jgi:hypothetical protein
LDYENKKKQQSQKADEFVLKIEEKIQNKKMLFLFFQVCIYFVHVK